MKPGDIQEIFKIEAEARRLARDEALEEAAKVADLRAKTLREPTPGAPFGLRVQDDMVAEFLEGVASAIRSLKSKP